jgi:serine/threonine protein kinase
VNRLVAAGAGVQWRARVDGNGGSLIASRLPRERQPVDPPEVIAGTLADIAPEQTGRMNSSLDSRSDLYASGSCCTSC